MRLELVRVSLHLVSACFNARKQESNNACDARYQKDVTGDYCTERQECSRTWEG